ncbi:MAG: ABC transporter substrate-binding protein [Acetobacteraceae bacterium]|nr:ABC transporter substrate-binding protein [Acetobacteraceae bacterium]
MIRLVLAAIAVLGLAPPSASAARRVVSLNLCTDQYLVLLAPEQIAALSPLSRDPALSFVAAGASRFPQTRASAEAVLRLAPDLVLAAPFGAQSTLALLEAEGVTVERIGLAQDFAAIRRETRQLATRLGEQARGEALVSAMDARLASIPHKTHPIRALIWEPRGYTAGAGSLGDAVLRAAGLENVGSGGRIGLETLLSVQPDVLVLPSPDRAPSLATELLDHPATQAIPRRFIPPSLTICAGPWTAEAAILLAR